MLGELFQADLETWKQFLTDRWYVLVIALIALLIVIKIVKTVVKWLLVAVIVIGVLLYSGYSLEDLRVDKLKELGAQITEQAAAALKREALEAMAGEAGRGLHGKRRRHVHGADRKPRHQGQDRRQRSVGDLPRRAARPLESGRNDRVAHRSGQSRGLIRGGAKGRDADARIRFCGACRGRRCHHHRRIALARHETRCAGFREAPLVVLVGDVLHDRVAGARRPVRDGFQSGCRIASHGRGSQAARR